MGMDDSPGKKKRRKIEGEKPLPAPGAVPHKLNWLRLA